MLADQACENFAEIFFFLLKNIVPYRTVVYTNMENLRRRVRLRSTDQTSDRRWNLDTEVRLMSASGADHKPVVHFRSAGSTARTRSAWWRTSTRLHLMKWRSCRGVCDCPKLLFHRFSCTRNRKSLRERYKLTNHRLPLSSEITRLSSFKTQRREEWIDIFSPGACVWRQNWYK